MLTLLTTSASPFGRKARIAAIWLGLSDRVEVENVDMADAELTRRNPLGKVPALICEDGTALFDSRVIVEYLDDLAGGNRLIPAGPDRFAVLRLQALADGIMDAAILRVYEYRYRPEDKLHQPWLDRQGEKMSRALDALEAAPPAPSVDAGTITLACALGYLDLRFGGEWRAGHPALAAWLDDFAERVPAFGATAPE